MQIKDSNSKIDLDTGQGIIDKEKYSLATKDLIAYIMVKGYNLKETKMLLNDVSDFFKMLEIKNAIKSVNVEKEIQNE